MHSKNKMNKDDDVGERFFRLVGEVSPLKRKPQSPNFFSERKQLQKKRIEAQNSRTTPLVGQGAQQSILDNFDNLDSDMIRAMQRGKIPLRREFDFHGYFVDDAVRLLTDALDERQNHRAEFWCVVHGKGKNSPRYDKAPLKTAIFDVLHSHIAVSAAVSQYDKDGDSGAVIVRVRRKNHKNN